MLKKIYNTSRSLVWLVSCLISLSACAQDKKTYTSPSGYDLTQPETFYLSDALHEISGITFPYKDSDVLVAIEDETGTLYQFRVGENEMSHGRFGKKDDYEDVAVAQQHIIVLSSDGSLFTMPLINSQEENIQNVIKSEDVIPDDEYEGLAVDPSDNKIYVLCKECKVDKKSDQVTGYVFEFRNNQPLLKGSFQIDTKQIDSFQSLKEKEFRPSALTKNIHTNEWYVLSSVNDMLVVTDQDWNVKAVHSLNPKDFNQPEGIAFDGNNNLYISNEGGDKTKKGTVLKFKISK